MTIGKRIFDTALRRAAERVLRLLAPLREAAPSVLRNAPSPGRVAEVGLPPVARIFITPRGVHVGAAGLMEIIDMRGTQPTTQLLAQALKGCEE